MITVLRPAARSIELAPGAMAAIDLTPPRCPPIEIERRSTLTTIDRHASPPLLVLVPGPQGPPGSPGLNAGTYPPVNFVFGDASPGVVLTFPEAVEVVSVSLQIEQAFNGIGASLALGTAAEPERLMPVAANAPGVIGTYNATPRAELAAGTQLMLTITTGHGATQGRGQFVLNAVPT